MGFPVYPLAPASLSDGPKIIIRPIRPEDDALEAAFIAGLSKDSRYNRLLGARRLTPEEARRLTRIDYHREMALIAVAVIDGKACQLGVARYVADAAAGGAEFAITVADAWQRLGIGSLLLHALIQHARAAGITRLHGLSFATNLAMQQLARRLGFVQKLDPQDATIRLVEKALAPAVPPALACCGLAHIGIAANDAAGARGDAPRSGKCDVRLGPEQNETGLYRGNEAASATA